MPSKDAMYDAKLAAAAKAAAAANASAIKQVGPQGGLNAGVIAGVKAPTSYPKKETAPVAPSASVASVGPQGGLAAGVVAGVKLPPASAPAPAKWVKAGTVQTINGPVDVDSSGKAEDGSMPIAKSEDGPLKPPETKFDPVGKLLRYEAGKTTGYRVAVYDDGKGGEFKAEETPNPVEPGSTGFETGGPKVTLARNTFANTMALLVGETEASQPWVDEMYDLAQGYINTGSSIEEAQNLALREAKNKGTASKFVQRFSAIFKLQDRLNKGETVQVPSIADYVNSEQKLGEVFRNVGLGELATQEMAAKILGDANKSVDEATTLISDVFGAIDNAPKQLKDDLSTYFPGADRTSIAKALLLGKEGAIELTKKLRSVEQISAAKSQGVTIGLSTGADLAAGGADYTSSLGKFAEVKRLERGQQLGRMSGIGFTQEEAIASTFTSNAAADEKIRKITEEEANRFAGRSGRMASQSRSRDF
jgi:hypothetical protein